MSLLFVIDVAVFASSYLQLPSTSFIIKECIFGQNGC
jgi:hypothetical protein